MTRCMDTGGDGGAGVGGKEGGVQGSVGDEDVPISGLSLQDEGDEYDDVDPFGAPT